MKGRIGRTAVLLALLLLLLPVGSFADAGTTVAGIYEKAMDAALEKALLLELDTTAALLKGRTGRSVAAALVSLLKAAEEIEGSGDDSGKDEAKTGGEEDKDGKSDSDSASGKKKISDSAYKRAKLYGEFIRDVDTQLIYCALLKKEGYDIAKVYPDGVEVDIDLRQYQPGLYSDPVRDLLEGSPTGQVFDASKVLIFSREDADQPELTWTDTVDPARVELDTQKMRGLRYESDYGYTVKLRVDLMQNEQLSDRYARSLTECKAYVILDRGYWKSIRQGYTVTDPQTEETTHHYGFGFSAFEAITFFSRENPRARMIWDSYDEKPPAYSATYENEGTESLTIIFNYTDRDGAAHTESYLMKNQGAWNIPRLMIGTHRDGWPDRYLKKTGVGLTWVEQLMGQEEKKTCELDAVIQNTRMFIAR